MAKTKNKSNEAGKQAGDGNKPAMTLPEGDQTLRLPKEEARVRRLMCNPGERYEVKIDANESVPFTMPPEVLEATEVVIARENTNWLGRDGVSLRAHICKSDAGVIILQPHSRGWKANVFGADRVTIAAL